MPAGCWSRRVQRAKMYLCMRLGKCYCFFHVFLVLAATIKKKKKKREAGHKKEGKRKQSRNEEVWCIDPSEALKVSTK